MRVLINNLIFCRALPLQVALGLLGLGGVAPEIFFYLFLKKKENL